MTDLLLFAADHVVTVVWLKSTAVALALILALALIGRTSAATQSLASTAAAAALVLLTAMQYLAPPFGLSVLEFPVFLFRDTALDLARLVTARPMPAVVAGSPIASLPLAVWLGAL
jgi:hypothetical protein